MTDRRPDDDRLRELFDDAVSDVDPAPALSVIRHRTKVTPMNRSRSWLVAAAAAVAVTAATVTTVALTGDDAEPDRAAPAATPDASPDTSPDRSPGTSPDGEGGTPSTSTDPTPSGAPEVDQTVPVYFVGDTPAGPRLFREFRRMTLPDDPAATAKAALIEAVGDTAHDPDYRSPWAALDVTVGLVTSSGGTVTVDLGGPLHDRPGGMSSAEAGMAVEQLVHTVQAVYQERVPVQLLLDGARTDALLGVPVAEPLAAGDPMEVQAPVWIIEPQDGSVGTGFVVTGRGAFFEATVSWQLLDGDRVVDEGFTTAEECCALSPFSFELPEAPPGDYVLRVYDADMSGGEGGGEAEDTKRITVR